MRDKIIVAIDVQGQEDFDSLIGSLNGQASFIKIGMELYYSMGPDIIKKGKDLNYKIFLDLKIHDIPNTAFRTAKALSKLNVDIINVHAAGGIEMMKAAKKGAYEGNPSSPPKIIAVTQLTSTDQNTLQNELLIKLPMNEAVITYAKNAQEAGLDGVVCSAQDVAHIKQACGKEFLCITPGIRPLGASADDQKRSMTPSEAINIGSDYLVVGRPITASDDPAMAYNQILKDISND